MLEASPLPHLPAKGLEPIKERRDTFHVALEYQSREEEAINGSSGAIPCAHHLLRFPFVLAVDGVVRFALFFSVFFSLAPPKSPAMRCTQRQNFERQT